jgi:hypothetical protein
VASELRPSIYVFLSPEIRPGDALSVFAFDDDYSFGVLTSSAHRTWFEERCSTLETRLRYTSRTIFETFPWPQSPSEDSIQRVTAAVKELFVFRQERIASGTSLVSLYDSMRMPGRNPLRELHELIDAAVIDAYGFSSTEDILPQLFALNEELHEAEAVTGQSIRGPGNQGLPKTMATTFMVTADPLS